MYVSVTGLRVKTWAGVPVFWWHAVRSLRQAQRSPGIISTAVRKVDGYQHTLSIWVNREAMRGFMQSGAHLSAIRAFPRIATGKICGFEAEKPPSWEEALAYWTANGREY